LAGGAFFDAAAFLSLAEDFDCFSEAFALPLLLLSDLAFFASFFPLASLPVDFDDFVVFLPNSLVSFSFFFSFEEVSFFLESAVFLLFFSCTFFWEL